jgi:hypothetical protein
MVSRRKKTYISLVLGIVSLQLLLPAIIFFSVLTVKQLQQNELADNSGTVRYEQIIINKVDAGEELKKGGEITYHGVLYDIKDIRSAEGQYIITALADTTETELLALNAKIVDQADGKDVKVKKVIPFFFTYHEQHKTWVLFEKAKDPEKFPSYLTFSLEKILGILSPPPKVACC